MLPFRGTHDLARLLQAVLLLGLAMQLGGRLSRRQALLGAAVATWSLISVGRAAEPTVAARECVILLGLGTLAFRLSGWSSHQQRRLVRLASLAMLGYGAILFTTTFIVLVLDGELDPFLLLFGFDNPRHLNHVQTVQIPLTLGLAATEVEARWRRVAWTSAFLAVAMAGFLMGRATLLSVTLAGLLLIALAGQAVRPYLRQAWTAMVSGLALGWTLLLLFRADLPGQAASTGSWENRMILCRAALDDAGLSLFGVGPMHFSRIERGDAAHPHNFYLQVAAEFGWPAALALVAAVVWALAAMARRLRRANPGEDRTWGMALWVTLVAIAIDACFSGNLVMPVSQVWIAIAAGLAMGWYGSPARAQPLRPAWGPGWRRAVTVCLLLALTVVSFIEFLQPNVRLLESQWRHLPQSDTFSPRFWRDGWF